MSNCGELIAPPATSTSFAGSRCVLPSARYSTATARAPSRTILSACAPVTTVRLRRLRAGLRYASAALHRRPRFWVTCVVSMPSCSGPLMSLRRARRLLVPRPRGMQSSWDSDRGGRRCSEARSSRVAARCRARTAPIARSRGARRRMPIPCSRGRPSGRSRAQLPRTYICALRDELPPSVFPRGQNIARPSRFGCGSVSYAQSYLVLNSLLNAAGMWISNFLSGGPASRSNTRQSGSSLSLPASTHPAEPAPTIT